MSIENKVDKFLNETTVNPLKTGDWHVTYYSDMKGTVSLGYVYGMFKDVVA